MANYEKTFKPIEDQISLLKKRELIFISEENAEKVLSMYSYYDIINGYKDLFIESKSEDDRQELYKKGTTFEQIYELYLFDKELRNTVFAALLDIEESIRAAVAYTISRDYGHMEKDYLQYKNYKAGKKYPDGSLAINQLFNKFNKIINDDVQPIKYYKEIHKNGPPWILTKGLTFGNVVTFIKLQKTKQKCDIYERIFGIPCSLLEKDEEIKKLLIESLFFLMSYRNWSGHGGRLYNHRSSKFKIPYHGLIHGKINVSEAEYNSGIGKSDMLALLGCSMIFVNKSPYNRILNGIRFSIERYSEKFPQDRESILNEMHISEELLKNLI